MHRGQHFSSACLSCSDFANCCGSKSTAEFGTEFDGASPTKKKGLSRRNALKIMGGVSAALALAPFAAAGSFLIPTISTKFNPVLIAKKEDVPVNGSTVFWFPFTTDPTYTNMLIHLPPDLAAKRDKSSWPTTEPAYTSNVSSPTSRILKSLDAHAMEVNIGPQTGGPLQARLPKSGATYRALNCELMVIIFTPNP